MPNPLEMHCFRPLGKLWPPGPWKHEVVIFASAKIGHRQASLLGMCKFLDDTVDSGWAAVLRAIPLLCESGGNRETDFEDFEGLYRANRAVQAHAILWRNHVATQDCLSIVQSKLAAGMVADNAVAAGMKKCPGRFLYLKPSLLIQNQL